MASPSSSSSSTRQQWIYNVFLNFRGEDTRKSLTSQIYTALTHAGILTFMDDTALTWGEEISSSLLQAIERSQIAIIIFSKNYASSSWCLDELVKIMECRRNLGQLVLPIFYNVDPSDVRHCRGRYGEAMNQHEQRFKRGDDPVRLLRWRTALTDATNLSGICFSNDGNEKELIKKLLRSVFTRLGIPELSVAGHYVGIESQVHELIIEWLKEGSQDVHIIGIWGMGGIGKTTLAKAIYNEIGGYFEGGSFLSNIREVSMKDNGQVYLQGKLISDINMTRIMKIPNIETGKNIIRERLPHRKALIVLDDLDRLSPVMALCGSREWFCPGSVIIITTRDMHLLKALEADYVYMMRELDESQSLELLSWHAFKQAAPSKKFMELSRSVVAYCRGIPLVLEVLGSFLFGRTIQEWVYVLSKLQRIPSEILAMLKISFDGLMDDMQKHMFLDICCFFINKDRGYVTQILNGCGFHAESGIQVLIERSLIKVSRNNKLEMHDLLQEMGSEIIRESSPKDPKKRSRLWLHKDVLHVLTKHNGTKAIEGISLKLPRTHRETEIAAEAFKAMEKLRLLQLDYVKLAGDYKYISKNLRWLCWHGFPLQYTPDNLHQENLVAIDFKYSSLKQVWRKPQLLERLKTLILSHSSCLTQTPDFTKLPNLEKLILKDCPSLISVHQSIGGLNNLLLVNLKDCKCLRDLPRSIYELKSLETLILSGCSMIDQLEEDFEQMESLTTLMADNTAITQVPFSLARLKSLRYMSMCGYEGRSQDIFPSIIWSWTSPINIPQSHSQALLLSLPSIVSSGAQNSGFRGLCPFLGYLSKLRSTWEECRPQFRLNGKIARLLDALYETNFMELESTPNTSQIPSMEASASSDGYNQVHIARPADSFNSLLIQMGACDKVDLLKERILQGWNSSKCDDSCLPSDQYPDWFVYKEEGHSLLFKVPLVIDHCLKAMVLNIVYSSCMENMTSQFLINILIINYTKVTVQHHKRESVTCHEDEGWQGIISSIEPGDIVEVVLSIGPQLTVNRIVAYPVYDGSKRCKLLK